MRQGVRLLGIVAVPAYLLAMYWPISAGFFELDPLGFADWMSVAGVAMAAYLLTRLQDREG